MPPTVLIAEDEPLLAQALEAGLRKIWPELRWLPSAGDGDEAVETALRERPRLLFLDIRMPGRSGLEAAQDIVEDWPADQALPLIVFVTAYDQYALQAFEASAVDYLLKPVQPARLAATCERLKVRLAEMDAASAPPSILASQGAEAGSAGPTTTAAATPPAAALADAQLAEQLRRLLNSAPQLLGAASNGAAPAPSAPPLKLIQAQVGHVVHLVPIDDVVYFEAADKYIRVLTAEREYLIRCALRELLAQLDEQLFWQVHRGTVVRATAITRAERDEAGRVFLHLRQRPERLPVSRIYAPRFKGM